MNNRFRFRVWDVKEEEYIEDLDIIRLTQYGKFVFNNARNNIEPELNPKRFIFEQCTGLKDINGKLIYEGDIILNEYGKWFIQYCENCKSYQCFDNTFGCFACLGDYNWFEFVENLGSTVVKGNIHEQGEL